MTVTTTDAATPDTAADEGAAAPAPADTPMVSADLLVEDVSIDGMCGVY
jgi:mycofactocin precursor